MKVQTLLLDTEENNVNEQLKPSQGLTVPASERASVHVSPAVAALLTLVRFLMAVRSVVSQ